MKAPRPRSADLGGLLLATAGNGYGGGWLGHGQQMDRTTFAELLSDMYTESCHAVQESQGSSSSVSTSLDIPQETREKLVAAVDEWEFEPHNLEEEVEVLACTMILFEALFRIEGLEEEVGVGLDQLYPLIRHLRLIYRRETSYHNFEHALDVLQASYIFLRDAGMVPSVRIVLEKDSEKMWRRKQRTGLITCLQNSDIFVLYIAAIGHDVAHPGITNGFMKNASAPLSQVYDNKSPLENLHCSVLLRVMRHHQLGELLHDCPTTRAQHLHRTPQDSIKDPDDEASTVNGSHSRSIRRLLYDTVLATDMSVHQGWMAQFNGVLGDLEAGRVGTDEEDLWRRRVLMCQAIIKCADISNPSRPFPISCHWSTALMGEWTSQASLERCLGLPCTVQDKDDPYSEAKSQIFFATTFVRPLWEVLVRGVPELQPFLDQCNSNIQTWRERQAELEAIEAHTCQPASDSDSPIPGDIPISETPPPPSSTSTAASFDDTASMSSRVTRIDDYATAFPLALPRNAGPTRYQSDTGDSGRLGDEEDIDAAGSDIPESDAGAEDRPRLDSIPSNIRVDVNVAHSRPISNATSATLFSPGGLRNGLSNMKHHHRGSSRSSHHAKAARGRVHSQSSSSNASAGDSGSYSPDTGSTSSSLFTPSDPDVDEHESDSGGSEYHSASGWSSGSPSPAPSRSISPVRRSESPSPVGEREGRSRTTSGMSEMSAVSGVSALSELSNGSDSQECRRAVSSGGATLLKKPSFNGVGGLFKFGGKNSNGQAVNENSSSSFWGRANAPSTLPPHASPHPAPSIISLTTPHASTQDPAHAALRAAAESASPGLRKKRSMASRNSWSPSPYEFRDLDIEKSPKLTMVNGKLSTSPPSSLPSPSFLPSSSPLSPLVSPSLSPPITASPSLGLHVLGSTPKIDRDKDVRDDVTPKKSKQARSVASSEDDAFVLT
ncbi:hypothetical protein D9758_003600 [Tetrapyrgos nigripes]|uniref:Phosphodiesterase n=1 Tax=Tetrapyrgos nigripes TaxID=182062 RepID=A0A8H5GVD7_9AGAR|nr:hypothetical protein D9758_003600 [Tetrapyrgos nigripes]